MSVQNIIHVITALSVCVGAVVKETTEHYSSNSDLKVRLDPRCEHQTLIGDKTYAQLTGQSNPEVQEPFYLDGDDLKISQNKDFEIRSYCVGADGYLTEDRVYYKYSSPDTAALFEACLRAAGPDHD